MHQFGDKLNERERNGIDEYDKIACDMKIILMRYINGSHIQIHVCMHLC